MTAYLAAILVFVAVVAAAAGIAPVLLRLLETTEDRIRARVDREFGDGKTGKKPLFSMARLNEPQAEETPGKKRRTLNRRFAEMVEHSGLAVSPSSLVRIAAVCGVLCGIAAGLAVSIELGLAAGCVGLVAPLLYVRSRARRRDDALLAQLPDILDLISRFLRAGHSLPQALAAVAGEFRDPARELFARFSNRVDLGISLDAALKELVDRAGLSEYRITVTAILTNYRSGGNLADACDRLASIVRERHRVEGMIHAFTAEGRLQARILMALPVGVFLVMLLVKRTYAESMLDSPRLLAAVVASQLIGILWIRRILRVNF